jgi:hypothetical protein
MIVLNFKKYLLSLIILMGFINSNFASTEIREMPFAERIANGDIGTVFLCKVINVIKESDKLKEYNLKNESGKSGYPTQNHFRVSNRRNWNDSTLVELITVYLGKLDTNYFYILGTSYYKVGNKYLMFRNKKQGTYIYKFVEIENNNLDSSIEIQSVKRYINILKQKLTGMFYYKTQNGNVLSEVEFKKGVPVNTWKEYNRDGWLEITYNLNSKVKCTYYQSGLLQRKDSTCNKDYFRRAYSDEKESKLYYKSEQIFLNDSNWKAKECNYFDELKELNWRLNNYYLPQLDELPDQACLHFNDGKIEGIEYQKVELYSNDSLIRRWIRSSENGRYIFRD